MRRNLSLGHLRVQQAGSAVIIIRRSVTLLLMLGMVAFLTAGRAASLRGDSRLLGRPEIQGTYGRLPLQ
ncbi:MAG TPA: hypothetical protein VHM88_14015, partial [Candidatus Acidoferrales bacterium]|nr:hypothetical protein [Candidatus Acidoferrales bacterium]